MQHLWTTGWIWLFLPRGKRSEYFLSAVFESASWMCLSISEEFWGSFHSHYLFFFLHPPALWRQCGWPCSRFIWPRSFSPTVKMPASDTPRSEIQVRDTAAVSAPLHLNLIPSCSSPTCCIDLFVARWIIVSWLIGADIINRDQQAYGDKI